jgi:hypothetical protein
MLALTFIVAFASCEETKELIKNTLSNNKPKKYLFFIILNLLSFLNFSRKSLNKYFKESFG